MYIVLLKKNTAVYHAIKSHKISQRIIYFYYKINHKLYVVGSSSSISLAMLVNRIKICELKIEKRLSRKIQQAYGT